MAAKPCRRSMATYFVNVLPAMRLSGIVAKSFATDASFWNIFEAALRDRSVPICALELERVPEGTSSASTPVIDGVNQPVRPQSLLGMGQNGEYSSIMCRQCDCGKRCPITFAQLVSFATGLAYESILCSTTPGSSFDTIFNSEAY